MAKERYRNQRYLDEMNDDTEEHVMQVEEELAQLPPADDPEEDSYKKRYGDLRRHMAQVEADYTRRITELEQKFNTRANSDIGLPQDASEDDLKEWLQSYPKVAAIVTKIARMEAGEASRVAHEANDKLAKTEYELAKEKAVNVIREKHPDWDVVIKSPEFWAWVDTQDEWVDHSITKEINARKAIDVLDLYKLRAGQTKPAPKKLDNQAGAAAVNPRSAAPNPNSGERYDFLESDIEKMSHKEYERKEAAIEAAIRDGRIKYDLSGGAR